MEGPKREQKALIIGEETVGKHLTAEAVIDICAKTWRWFGEGKVVMHQQNHHRYE